MCGDSIRMGDGFAPSVGRGDAGNRCAACHGEKRDRQGLCVSRARQTAGSLHQTAFMRRMIGINPPIRRGPCSHRVGYAAASPRGPRQLTANSKPGASTPRAASARWDRLEEDRQVKRQRPALEVDEVEVHEVVEVELRAP